ncbi:MAG: uroporphyrinogen-III C-methyltransferase [Desulfobacteraceae bacterium]|nr:MAG: uroporphyrinogen-III C-methyltransferase [Desulfobacteraceae bacterium]
METSKKGKVYLVGAGPGDPGLITVKGRECIERADVVVYDYLASPSLLKYAKNKSEIIYVGKQGGDHTLSQDGINALIVEKAKKGFTVTRLKGGDPFIFGRGAEEAEVLIENGISFEVVPGVTSAIAAPAYAGIPLTHRSFTSTVAFVTGHEDPEKAESGINWEALAKGIGTIVFLMGVKNLPNIVMQLVNNGISPNTPAAVVRWGTTPKQRSVSGTIGNIGERVKSAGIKSPAVIIVGNVVKLKEKMDWFESKPLFGKRIVVTRAREQASDLVGMLSDLGAECLEFPTIKVEPPDDFRPLDKAIENLSTYDWLIFTSVNGVSFFFERLHANGLDIRAFHKIKTAVIGPATSDRLFCYGLKSDVMPESYRAESVIDAFRTENLNGKRILLPRAEEARAILPEELTKMGALVDEITAYRTRAVTDEASDLIKELKNKAIDLITFTSSSTVKNFAALLPAGTMEEHLGDVVIAAIGPVTADTAKDMGFKVSIIAESFTISGLCDAILQHYLKR